MNTAQDVVDFLLTATGGGAQDGEHRAVRTAVVSACRDIYQTRDWLWHTTEGTFTTNQVSTTATIVSGSPVITVASATGFVKGRLVIFGANGYFSMAPRIRNGAGADVL